MARPSLHVSTICTGNICRSPMAEVVLKHLVAGDSLLKDHVIVTSAGTARWHVGAHMDPRARAALDRAGLTLPGSIAAYADAAYLRRQDLVVVMSREHQHEVVGRLQPAAQLLLWRNLLEPGLDLDVPDPYFGNDQEFDDCLAIFRAAGPRLTSALRQRWGERSNEV
ncbi:MAG TPA: low molecular weight protein-tyrosine-phosphatase [Acidimicrobiales bacterium]|nr:low molecular weight protein-tyrosine-phosphatase [Acidimicrobiales bacterium]